MLGMYLERPTYGKRRITARRIGSLLAVRASGHGGNERGRSAIRLSVSDTAATKPSPSPGDRSSYQSAARRNSRRASGWRTTRTPLRELLRDLGVSCFPRGQLNTALRDLLGTLLEFGHPRGGRLVVGFLDT
jgi:hypothetical protein